jgi:hypothetical protein
MGLGSGRSNRGETIQPKVARLEENQSTNHQWSMHQSRTSAEEKKSTRSKRGEEKKSVKESKSNPFSIPRQAKK